MRLDFWPFERDGGAGSADAGERLLISALTRSFCCGSIGGAGAAKRDEFYRRDPGATGGAQSADSLALQRILCTTPLLGPSGAGENT